MNFSIPASLYGMTQLKEKTITIVGATGSVGRDVVALQKRCALQHAAFERALPWGSSQFVDFFRVLSQEPDTIVSSWCRHTRTDSLPSPYTAAVQRNESRGGRHTRLSSLHSTMTASRRLRCSWTPRSLNYSSFHWNLNHERLMNR